MSIQSLALKNFVKQKTQEKNMSMRQLAAELGLSHSYLSEILNGKKPLDIVLGNKIADYFGMQRVSLYALVGWLELDEDEDLLLRIKEYSKKNPDFAKFVEVVLNMKDEKERRRMMRLLRAGMEE